MCLVPERRSRLEILELHCPLTSRLFFNPPSYPLSRILSLDTYDLLPVVNLRLWYNLRRIHC